MGLWDYTRFEIGIIEISFEIGIMDLKSNQIGFSVHVNWDYWISPYLKLGLWDYASFEIWITGLQDPPYWVPVTSIAGEIASNPQKL